MTAKKKKVQPSLPFDDTESKAQLDGYNDPEMYARLNRPWPSQKAADEAISDFFRDAYDLRVKHGIADVTIVALVKVNREGTTGHYLMSHHSGDSAKRLSMLASAFRSIREKEDADLLELAGLAAPDVFDAAFRYLQKEGAIQPGWRPSDPAPVQPSPPAPPAATKTRKEEDREMAVAFIASIAEPSDDAHERQLQDAQLALRLHDGDPAAREELRRRYEVVKDYLMLWGGTQFLNAVRRGIQNEEWWRVVEDFWQVEFHLRDMQHLRLERVDGRWRAVPKGKGRWAIPADIDAGELPL